jgi:hypothetical protein
MKAVACPEVTKLRHQCDKVGATAHHSALQLGAFAHALPIKGLLHLLMVVVLVAVPLALLVGGGFVFRLRKGPV